jgi:tetratricopeptide (TPR) repeat protein
MIFTNKSTRQPNYFWLLALLLIPAFLFCKYVCFQSQPKLLATGFLQEFEQHSPQSRVASLLEDRKYDELLRYFEEMAVLNPDNINATLIRAEIYANYKGDLQEARKLLQAAARKYPGDSRIQFALEDLQSK